MASRLAGSLTLLGVLVALVASGLPVAAGHLSNGALPPLGKGFGGALGSPVASRSAAIGPASTYQNVSVTRTIDLLNGSVWSGNVRPQNLPEPGFLTTISSSASVLGTTPLGGTGQGGQVFEFDSSTGQVTSALPANLGDPAGAAYVSATNALFVAETGVQGGGGLYHSQVSVYQASPFSFVQGLSAGNESYAVAYDPENSSVLVSNLQSSNLWSYDIHTFAVHVIAVGVDPMAIAYDAPKHVVIVSNQGSSNITVLNASTLAHVGNLATFGSPRGIGIAADGTAYVAEEAANSVAEIDPVGLVLDSQVVTGPSPASIVIDPVTAIAYVVGSGAGANVTEFNTSSQHYAGSLSVANGPHYLALSGSGDRIVMANAYWSNLTVISGSTRAIVSTTRIGAAPFPLVVDPLTGTGYWADYLSGEVSSLAAGAGGFVDLGRSESGILTQAAGFDTVKGTVWFAGPSSQNITVFTASTGQFNRSFSRGFSATALAFDGADNRMYVANASGPSVIPVGGTSDYAEYPVSVSTPPRSEAYDPWNGLLYVGGPGGIPGAIGSVDAVNASTEHKVKSTVGGGGSVSAFAFDPVLGTAYAFHANSNDMDTYVGPNPTASHLLLNGSSAIQGISSATFDPVTGYIYALDSLEDIVLVINPSDASVLQVVEVGNQPQSIAYDYPAGYVVVTNLGSGTLSILGDPATYAITFQESGLFSGMEWGVYAQQLIQWSYSSTVVLHAQNGTVDWTLQIPNHYNTSTPVTGTVTVNGTDQIVLVHFQPNGTHFPVYFYQRTLPNQATWFVHLLNLTVLVNGTIHGSSQTIITGLQNGTYEFSVPGIPGYIPTPAAGTFNVTGHLVNITITFNPALFAVTFTESGLPAGTAWGVTLKAAGLSAAVNHSTTTTATVNVPNGTYNYVLTPVPGYNATVPSGTLTISGLDQGVPVLFLLTNPNGSGNAPSTPANLNAGAIALGITALAVLLIAAALVLEWRERRAPSGSGGGSSSLPDAPEPSPGAAPEEGPKDPENPDAAPPEGSP